MAPRKKLSRGKPAAAAAPDAGKPEFPSWDTLADLLHVEPRRLRHWKQRPDAPREPDADKWRAFIAKHGLGTKSNAHPQIVALRAAKLHEEVELLRLKKAQLEGSSIPAEDVREFHKSYAAKLDLLLTLKLETEAPVRCNGKTIAEMRAVLRQIHDEIRAATRAGLLKFKLPPAQPAEP